MFIQICTLIGYILYILGVLVYIFSDDPVNGVYAMAGGNQCLLLGLMIKTKILTKP